jgi:cyclophilin family peptidyl-prolyl cis-trans isomerase
MILTALLSLLLQAPAPPSAAPAGAPTPTGPVVVLETSLGTLRIALDKDKAPATVDNFLQYVRAGHYDGTVFHRVIPGFMIQGGGMDASMKERETRPPIRNEASNGLRNLRGTIAMARTNDPHSATAQFFINVKDNASLDYGMRGAGYAVFGSVVEGMDVVDRIVAVPTATRPPHQNVPTTPVTINSARVEGEMGATRTLRGTGGPSPTPRPRLAPLPSPSPAGGARPSPRPTPRPSPQP